VLRECLHWTEGSSIIQQLSKREIKGAKGSKLQPGVEKERRGEEEEERKKKEEEIGRASCRERV